MTDFRPISCDECQQRLEEFALDELSETEGRQVSNHLATGCYVCNLELAQLVADWSVTPSFLPADLPPLRIERELMQSIAGKQPRPVMSSAVPIPDPPRTTVARKSNKRLIAAVFAAAACLVGLATWTSWRAGNGSDFTRNLAAEAAYQAELQRRFDQADHSQHFSAIPQLNFTYVNNPAPPRPVYGFVVADAITRQWHMYTFNLPPLAGDRAYQVWLITKDSEFIAVGPLDVDAQGTANKMIDLPSDIPQFSGIAISDEPTAGSIKPTGPNFVKADLP